jgi:hypothetical protein
MPLEPLFESTLPDISQEEAAFQIGRVKWPAYEKRHRTTFSDDEKMLFAQLMAAVELNLSAEEAKKKQDILWAARRLAILCGAKLDEEDVEFYRAVGNPGHLYWWDVEHIIMWLTLKENPVSEDDMIKALQFAYRLSLDMPEEIQPILRRPRTLFEGRTFAVVLALMRKVDRGTIREDQAATALREALERRLKIREAEKGRKPKSH